MSTLIMPGGEEFNNAFHKRNGNDKKDKLKYNVTYELDKWKDRYGIAPMGLYQKLMDIIDKCDISTPSKYLTVKERIETLLFDDIDRDFEELKRNALEKLSVYEKRALRIRG